MRNTFFAGFSTILSRAFAITLISLSVSCAMDDEASIQGPREPLARGAYYSVDIGDSCEGGGGKAPNFCSTENITNVITFESKDPDIVRLVGASEIAKLDAEGSYIYGNAVGKTSLELEAEFDDGSVRSDSLDITVKEVTRMKLVEPCRHIDDKADELLVPVGQEGQFSVALHAGDQKLVGWLPDALQTPGLTDVSRYDSTDFIWQAPSEPTRIELTSSYTERPIGTLVAIGPSAITSVEAKPYNYDENVTMYAPGIFHMGATVLVKGKEPCGQFPVAVRTETPAVCAGPKGETEWNLNDADHEVGALAEGNCRLTMGAVGGKLVSTWKGRIFMEPKPPADEPQGYATPCDVEGMTACLSNYSVAHCKDGEWSYVMTECHEDQICTYIDPASDGCVGGFCAKCRGLRN